MSHLPKAEHADVALLLEGTYPYVSGGVSSWVHQLIRGFPEYRFACVFLGSRPGDYGDQCYSLPDNVVHVETHYLHDSNVLPAPEAMTGDVEAIALVAQFHDRMRQLAMQPDADRTDLAGQFVDLLHHAGVDEMNFLYSKAAWTFITDRYRRHCTDPSFVDFFWTVRSMHRPIWSLQRIAQNMIPVSFFHTISTGYAGFLGALLKQRTGRPLLLSEHGIYTKERKIDLLQSDWLVDHRDVFQMDPTRISYFRELWIRFFESFGRVCYDAADQTVALFETNRHRQVEDGASATRSRCIPNGISVERFASIRAGRVFPPPRVLCLIGRVVPIKDVKTFIRAMRIVVNRFPDAQGWIAGPEGEDPEYVSECKALAASLGLNENLRFLGFQKLETLLPKVGLTVLSSISEGLPLVMLESMAAGVPTVVTDVGACRELIEGSTVDDRSIGCGGAVVRIADPQALADAALGLLSDEQRWRAASNAGFTRVSRYYRDSQMLDAYRSMYQELKAAESQHVRAAARCPHADHAVDDHRRYALGK